MLKANVNLANLSPQILLAYVVADRVFNEYGHYCLITSANDSRHRIGSLHYSGNAIDLRTKHISKSSEKLEIVNKIKESLTNDFDVLFESANTPNEHIHIEYQPKSN